ncbi:MAG: choice-of-anchor D domain-containing protein [Bacteroidota bacterium]
MNFTKFTVFIAVILLSLPAIGRAQAGTQGREFWIAIPPNEKTGYPTNAIEIYVTSRTNTTVILEAPGLGYKKTKNVEAFKITTFGAADGIGGNFEVRDGGVTPYALQITSDHPISVNVLNAKTNTSEGYTALPVSVWGRENIHCSYYDFGEMAPWGGGFLVVASQNQTVISVQIKGQGFGRTTEGNKIGDRITKTLNKGDVYNMRGDGATIGSFDLTGTTVTSNKPVGLISYHERVMIPAIALNNGRDHLSEMIPPTSAWGKTFVSAEFKRKGNGDLFRAVAKEAGTTVTGVWYNKSTNQKMGSTTWVLNNPGQFQQSLYASESPGGQDITGYSVWTSNKPILLMQYSYSANWDGAVQFDPMMIVVPPVEQYLQSAIFQTPASQAYNINSFNLFAIADTTDNTQQLLKSIKLDGKALYEIDSKILIQRIPGTNIHYVERNVTPGTHTIESDTKLAGFMYGFSSFDSYGWPAAMSVNKVDELDTNEPVLKVVQDCGLFKINATELREGAINDNPRQIESGIFDVSIIPELSTNFKTQPTPVSIQTDPTLTKHDFTIEVLDKTKDARAVYEVIDRAGNIARDTVDYIADKLTLNVTEVDFGKVRVGTKKDINVVLKNTGSVPISLQNIRVNNPDIFYLANTPQQQLAPGAEIILNVWYSPKMEFTSQFHDKDSLIITTGCTQFAYTMAGRGVIPKIAVGDFNAGVVKIGEKFCLESGLKVFNPGTENVTITGISSFDTPFTFTNQTFPITLAPGDTLFLKDVCFQSTTAGNFVQQITFKSDAMSGDSISEWRGSTTPTSVEEDSTETKELLKITPNPASGGEIQIEYFVTKAGVISLELFDATGKSVKTLARGNTGEGSFNTGFSVSELPIGAYYCRMTIDNILIASEEIVIVK